MYYFGVWPGQDAGHYLYDHTGRRVAVSERYELFPFSFTILDGYLMPYAPELGIVYEASINGWRVFSFLDQTGDSRPGSVSTFIGRNVGGGWYMTAFRAAFPSVFERLGKAGITLRGYDHEEVK